MSNAVALMGDEYLISGLNIFGFDTFSVNGQDKIKDIFSQILKQNYFICFIQEAYFPKIKELLLEIEERPYPMVLTFSGHWQPEGIARNMLKEMSIKAVGQDILR